jgi:hypothetical protein
MSHPGGATVVETDRPEQVPTLAASSAEAPVRAARSGTRVPLSTGIRRT